MICCNIYAPGNFTSIPDVTGELVDTRSQAQKKRAKALTQSKQAEMFSQREMAQFGVTAHPKLPLSPKTKLELTMYDPRSDAEKAQQMQQEVEENTIPMPWVVAALPSEAAEVR